MKKKLLSLFFASTLLLSACGGDNTESTDKETIDDDVEEVEATDEEEVVEAEDVPEQQVGEVIKTEGGTRELLAINYGIDQSIENGPFTITLKNAQLSQFQPSKDMVDFFEGEDLGMVALEIEVEHHSEDTDSIYPDQGLIVTDNGHQVNADTFLSEEVGGEFHGKVIKSGDVFFFFNDDASEVNSIKFIIESGHDEKFDRFDDKDIEFTVDF